VGVQEVGQRFGASLLRHPWRWFAGTVALLFLAVPTSRVSSDDGSTILAVLMVVFTGYAVIASLVLVPRILVPRIVRSASAPLERIAALRWAFGLGPAIFGMAARLLGVTWAGWTGWAVSTALLAYTAATIDHHPPLT